VAKEYSQCPSAKSGGSLGVFKPGQMVAEFDRWEIDREMD
jgi:parvulin-like peptidyl-prolyl isomerase